MHRCWVYGLHLQPLRRGRGVTDIVNGLSISSYRAVSFSLGWPPGTRRDLGCYLDHPETSFYDPNPHTPTELPLHVFLSTLHSDPHFGYAVLQPSCTTVWVGRYDAQYVCWVAWQARVVGRMLPCTCVLMPYRANAKSTIFRRVLIAQNRKIKC